jgi:Zn-finger nucleic acid-binding protein
MQCPNCANQTLVTSQRRDIEIDHCPNCGGVWLDRGELEKIVRIATEEHGSGRDWDRSGEERDESYGRSQRRSDDDDEGEGGYEGEGRYQDEDEGGEYRERERYGRDREPSSEEGRRGERPSIWREIFENLEKLPLPRV